MNLRHPAALAALLGVLICMPTGGMAVPPETRRVRLVPRDTEGVEKFFALKFQEAEAAFERGQIDRAGAIAGAIHTLAPKSPIHKQVQELRDKCQQAKLRNQVVAGDAVMEKSVVTSGEKATITFRLRNVGTYPIQIPPNVVTTKRFLLPDTTTDNNVIHVKFTESVHVPGTVYTKTTPQTLTFDKEIKLDPGEEWSETFEVDTRRLAATPGMVTTVRIAGKFVPLYIVHDEGIRQFNQLLLAPATFLVMPKGWKDRVDPDKPLKSLTRGLRTGEDNTILYAAALIPKGQADVAAKRLIGALEKSKPDSRLSIVIMSSLARVTGRFYRLERQRWLRWWKHRSEAIAREAITEAGKKKEAP